MGKFHEKVSKTGSTFYRDIFRFYCRFFFRVENFNLIKVKTIFILFLSLLISNDPTFCL